MKKKEMIKEIQLAEKRAWDELQLANKNYRFDVNTETCFLREDRSIAMNCWLALSELCLTLGIETIGK